MQQIINFFLRNKTFLLFLLLFSLAIVFTIQSHSFHKSRYVNSANFVSGSVYNTVNDINAYFDLKEENLKLQSENNRLSDSTVYSTYKTIPALVIKNDYALNNNVLLINKGKNHHLKQDLAVVSPKGVVGITDRFNSKYTTVLSILNTNTLISAKLKKSNHFGTISWNTKSPKYVQLTEIPKIAIIKKGDTIVTSGRSSIFPSDILIGKVKSYQLDKAENFFNVEVELFNDMTSLDHVYIINNKDKKQIENLLNNSNDQ
jgi:rod shape-determining protein MreC